MPPLSRALGPLGLAALLALSAGAVWRAAARADQVNAARRDYRAGGALPAAPPASRPEGVDRRPIDPEDASPTRRRRAASEPPVVVDAPPPER